MMNELDEVFRYLARALTDMMYSYYRFIKDLEELVNSCYEEPIRPREYGISLLHYDRFNNVKPRYAYINGIPKNLPYMRRCF